MANPTTRELHAQWREKISSSKLITRLDQFAMGEIELSRDQIKAIEILLKKTIPDLKAIELTVDGSGAKRFSFNMMLDNGKDL